MTALIFDIETGPRPEAELKEIMPEFDPEQVKTGNFGEEKAKAKIAAARRDHEANFFERAALSAVSGRVIVIGYQQSGGECVIEEDLDERQHLEMFWQRYTWARSARVRMVGWNIHGFDLPFIVRRSWFHGVAVPETIMEREHYWDPTFADLMKLWCLGEYGARFVLHNAARFFGHDGKNGDGAEFAKLWENDRPTAIAYLENDLEMTEIVATNMGVC